jgi:hypothetical protein
MNAAGQGESKEALDASDQQSDGLTGVAVNEFWLGVVGGLLMEFFNCRHFATAFGQLDSIAYEDGAVMDFRHEGGRQDGQDQASPKGREGVDENRFAVEKIEEAVIENLLQA